ncbi:acetyl-coenzyme A synthetase [Terriglobus roseus DSM 18391]|uniref:Acetyl-coenzyme A synthetase n=1 Tax=Terriglobus roseus (strain DSM 18391 / NRRL B-41598 / KBS 63) TaxID=926566 RepID=I3ZKB1_TERRK|nr:acetate--CoA ligase [Terriglobus roseus]AFL89679.1 acetyl-coenzyme A synthetase [Terriglobus roseus DSM 18391]
MVEQHSEASPNSFTSTMREDRLFPPPPEFAARAHIRSRAEYDEMYRRSIDDNEAFWAEQAQALDWFKPFDKVLEWNVPEAKWFVGGKLNLCHNAVDRHALGSRADKTALLWEGEPGEVRSLTYAELHAEVQRFANVLKSLGIAKGDRVAIYMGVCPEIVLAVLACARIGAVHNVVFGGFAAQALADRMNDAQCKLLITQDTSFRRGQDVALKSIADEALDRSPGVEHVLVYQRSGKPVSMKEGRDHWLHEELAKADAECAAEPMDSEDPLYILYTSGTTGKPKGLVHTTGGYGVGTLLTTKYIFDLQDSDVYWCTADVGWVTGHSYVVYGPLLNGATIMLYEGAPNWPECDRFWQIVDRHKVSIFYTAPTAIRAFMKWGTEHVHKHSLASLRMLGTVGEPINPEAWMWYHREIGKKRCPIADTWWQTETGSIMIAPIPGAVPTKPGSATLPFFGIEPEIVTKEGEPVPLGHGGLLVVRKPWPAMARTIFGDAERYKKAYWSEIPGSYFTGDGARRDMDGYFWLMGRVDDVLNISGHRLGTAEIESALVAHPKVAEAAVVGRPDEMKGEGIVVFVSLHDDAEVTPTLKDELKKHVAKEIGALARPDEIRFTPSLPKTRSGKIMRRLLRELAATGDVKGDTTTLEDFSVVAKLKEKDEE